MKKTFILFSVLVSLFFYLLPAFSENEAEYVFEPFTAAFENPTRPYARFDHDAHIERTNDSCITCHHSYVDGKLVEEDSSDQPCMSCHPADNPEGTRLLMAYHKQCRGCHQKQAGPLACGECHVRKK